MAGSDDPSDRLDAERIADLFREVDWQVGHLQRPVELADLSLFAAAADRWGVPLELAPVLVGVFDDAAARYGAREWSPSVIRRLEDATGASILAPGFPAQMIDDESEAPGREVVASRGG